MFIGRYYFDKKKWIPAINRFRIVVDNYETTIYVEEAIHRLVEIYYILGIETEAKNMLIYWVIIINHLNGMKSLLLFLIKIIKLKILRKKITLY